MSDSKMCLNPMYLASDCHNTIHILVFRFTFRTRLFLRCFEITFSLDLRFLEDFDFD